MVADTTCRLRDLRLTVTPGMPWSLRSPITRRRYSPPCDQACRPQLRRPTQLHRPASATCAAGPDPTTVAATRWTSRPPGSIISRPSTRGRRCCARGTSSSGVTGAPSRPAGHAAAGVATISCHGVGQLVQQTDRTSEAPGMGESVRVEVLRRRPDHQVEAQRTVVQNIDHGRETPCGFCSHVGDGGYTVDHPPRKVVGDRRVVCW